MKKAKEKGIKNFRVLNKAELAQILSNTITQEEIEVIVKAAVARWKNGWGKKKNQSEKADSLAPPPGDPVKGG